MPGYEGRRAVRGDLVKVTRLQLLQSAGYRILVASGGGAALALLRERNHEIDRIVHEKLAQGLPLPRLKHRWRPCRQHLGRKRLEVERRLGDVGRLGRILLPRFRLEHEEPLRRGRPALLVV